MFVSAVGNIVEVNRHIKDTKLSTIRVAQNYSGLTVEDGKYGKKDTGYFTYQVWEENLMVGTNSNFSKTMDSLKPGSTVEILAELTDRTTKEDGKTTDRRITLTALKIGYVNTARPQDETTRVATATTEGFVPVESTEDPGYAPDPFA
jgi:hypothetical protein